MEMLPDTILVVKDIIKIIKLGAESIVSKKNLKRVRVVDLNISSSSVNNMNVVVEATIIIYNENRYNLIELLEALYKISINDKMKYTVYQDFGMKCTLKEIIIYGNEIEKEYATRLLYQLCFDSNVCAKVGQDDELVSYFRDSKKHETTNNFLKKNIFGIKQKSTERIFFFLRKFKILFIRKKKYIYIYCNSAYFRTLSQYKFKILFIFIRKN